MFSEPETNLILTRLDDALAELRLLRERIDAMAPGGEGSLTVTQIARQLRTSPDTIRAWIKSGQLKAANLATGPRPRYVVSQDDLSAFLKRRQPEPQVKRQPRRQSGSFKRYRS